MDAGLEPANNKQTKTTRTNKLKTDNKQTNKRQQTETT